MIFIVIKCKYLAFPLPRGTRCRADRDATNFQCRVSSSLAELSYRLKNIFMDKILRVLSDRYRKQIIEKNEATKNCNHISSNGKQTTRSTTIYFTYHSCIESCCMVGETLYSGQLR